MAVAGAGAGVAVGLTTGAMVRAACLTTVGVTPETATEAAERPHPDKTRARAANNNKGRTRLFTFDMGEKGELQTSGNHPNIYFTRKAGGEKISLQQLSRALARRYR